ncbi:hypothetical protein CC2G_007894 [Coprinopsis cinerea AmutBmut pab1-1]|nr:hypothetical protein CC2G_007894 [Coprinopsis cinerea AmutBmut pab1-1]
MLPVASPGNPSLNVLGSGNQYPKHVTPCSTMPGEVVKPTGGYKSTKRWLRKPVGVTLDVPFTSQQPFWMHFDSQGGVPDEMSKVQQKVSAPRSKVKQGPSSI